jgi:hypothetical protein
MLTYETLKEKPKDFLAATSLAVEEYERLLPIFRNKYAELFEAGKTRQGKPRQRRAGGGVKEKLRTPEDKLLFILVYQKTYPLQTMHEYTYPQYQDHGKWEVRKALRRTLAKYKLHTDTELFEKVYGYVKEYY